MRVVPRVTDYPSRNTADCIPGLSFYSNKLKSGAQSDRCHACMSRSRNTVSTHKTFVEEVLLLQGAAEGVD